MEYCDNTSLYFTKNTERCLLKDHANNVCWNRVNWKITQLGFFETFVSNGDYDYDV